MMTTLQMKQQKKFVVSHNPLSDINKSTTTDGCATGQLEESRKAYCTTDKALLALYLLYLNKMRLS